MAIDRRLHVRLGKSEHEKLVKLARESGETVSEVARVLLISALAGEQIGAQISDRIEHLQTQVFRSEQAARRTYAGLISLIEVVTKDPARASQIRAQVEEAAREEARRGA